jgi:hypothetical protein
MSIDLKALVNLRHSLVDLYVQAGKTMNNARVGGISKGQSSGVIVKLREHLIVFNDSLGLNFFLHQSLYLAFQNAMQSIAEAGDAFKDMAKAFTPHIRTCFTLSSSIRILRAGCVGIISICDKIFLENSSIISRVPRCFSSKTKSILKTLLLSGCRPLSLERAKAAKSTGLTRQQINNWIWTSRSRMKKKEQSPHKGCEETLNDPFLPCTNETEDYSW